MIEHDRFVGVEIDGVSWLVAEDFQPEPLFASRTGWSHGKLIRATPHRRVLQVEGRSHTLLVKHFVHSGIRAGLKATLRGPPAWREWKALREAQQRGLPLPKPLALGWRGRIWKRESFLVTDFIEQAIPLSHYLFGPDRPVGAARRRAFQGVAKLVRRAHESGFYQPDLHADNILVRPSQPKLGFFLIDFQRVIFRSSLSSRNRWRNLSVLNGGCTDASLVDRLRFLKSYLSSSPPMIVDLRKLVVRLERAGWKHRLHLWRSRGKRCLAENRDFLKIGVGEFSGFARRASWSEDFQGWIDGFGQFVGSAEWVQDFPAVSIPQAHGVTLRVQKYRCRGFGQGLRNLIYSSAARRAWMGASQLQMRGIPVVLPIAYLEKRRLGTFPEGYVVAKDVSRVLLSDFFADFLRKGLSIGEKRRLLSDFARLVGRMHRRGATYSDLKASKFAAHEDSKGNNDVRVVDFDGLYLGAISRRVKIKNLAALAKESCRYTGFTSGDRLRFLKTYLGRKYGKNWKAVWFRVGEEVSKSTGRWKIR